MERGKLHVAANRYGQRQQFPWKKAQEALGLPTAEWIPDPDDIDIPMHALIGGHGHVNLAFFPIIRADNLEAWATLDDANVGRFVEMLRGMQSHTQFILITHNRKTMEIADRLYGVTMEEPGVSKLISVNLN